eukprot:scaffold5357_cov208-Amphora_coffeaeformis.AAC.22
MACLTFVGCSVAEIPCSLFLTFDKGKVQQGCSKTASDIHYPSRYLTLARTQSLLEGVLIVDWKNLTSTPRLLG